MRYAPKGNMFPKRLRRRYVVFVGVYKAPLFVLSGEGECVPSPLVVPCMRSFAPLRKRVVPCMRISFPMRLQKAHTALGFSLLLRLGQKEPSSAHTALFLSGEEGECVLCA